MLGLGDIVIPGIFIAFLLRFDERYVQTFSAVIMTCVFKYYKVTVSLDQWVSSAPFFITPKAKHHWLRSLLERVMPLNCIQKIWVYDGLLSLFYLWCHATFKMRLCSAWKAAWIIWPHKANVTFMIGENITLGHALISTCTIFFKSPGLWFWVRVPYPFLKGSYRHHKVLDFMNTFLSFQSNGTIMSVEY